MTTLWTSVVIAALVALVYWGGSRNRKLRAIAPAVAALIWTIFSAFALQDVSWPFPRPIGVVWIGAFIFLAAGTVALVIFRLTKLARVLSWVAVALAVLLSCVGAFTLGPWIDWASGPLEGKAIIVVFLLIGFAFSSFFEGLATRIVGVMAYLIGAGMIVAWVVGAFNTGYHPSAPVPTAPSTSAAVPTAPPTSAPATTAPSTSNTDKELRATEGSIIGWDNVIAAVDEQNATWWPTLVDNNQSKLGFNWSDAKTWGTTKAPNGQIIGARQVVVFDADKTDISDKAARKLVGVAGNKAISVVRANGCFTAVADNSNVCPSGDNRVVLFVGRLVTKNGKVFALKGSGIALIPTSDNKVTLTPATYVARS